MNILEQAATLLGGHVSNGQILCPGPNHGHEDRSLSIKLDPTHPDGFVYHSFAGDELETCRTFIKSKIGHLLSGYVSQSDPGSRAKLQFLTATTDEGLYEAASRVMSGVNPDHIYLYRDETGQVIVQAIARWDDIKGKKEIRPFSFTEIGWKCRALPASRPLFNLDQIASNSNSDVLMVEGEKAAEAAAEWFDGTATTWAGGSQAVDKTDFSVLAGRNVYLCPDNDDAGRKAMDQVAERLQQYGANVQIVDLKVLAQHRPNGPELSEGWDLADASEENWDPQSINEAIRSSSKSVAPVALVAQSKPLPLYPEVSPPQPFPTYALGKILAPVTLAISRKCQVPEAMAAQSVLAVGSLATQSHANVVMPYGQERPAGAYFVTVAGSGDRKSTADNEALRGVTKYEKNLRAKYDIEIENYRAQEAAYNIEKRRIEQKKEKGYRREDRQRDLKALGPKPEKPLHPIITASDTTVEGLVKNWPDMHAGIGLFSAEGGQFTGGYGMAEESRLRTAAHLSSLWDGSSVKRLRATDGVLWLHGRRLTFHMMLQVQAAATFLSDSVLRDQGLLSRILVSAAPSLAGTRFHKPVAAEDEATIEAFSSLIYDTLNLPVPLVEGRRNELEPRAIPLSEDAKEIFFHASDLIESQMGKEGNLEGIKDVGAKTPENAARLACILTLIENIAAQEITRETMECALKLADWYLGEASRLNESRRLDPQLVAAQNLLDWIHASGLRKFNQREIMRNGPKNLRTKAALKPILTILVDHNWLVPLPHGIFLVVGRESK